MKIPRRDTHGSVGFDMTPMIDIVFQLIIFFLLTGHLVKQETQMQLALPEAASGEEQELDDDTPRLTVNVQPDGQVSLGSGVVTNNELIGRLAEKRAAVGDSLEVRIRSDRSVPYRVVEPIMLACTKVGIWKVTFAVLRPGESQP
jgi:biopolymer transport protein ExbD